jgi:hypothetical protein
MTRYQLAAAIQIVNPKGPIRFGAESKERLEQATKLIEQGSEAAEIAVEALLRKGWVIAVQTGSSGKVVRADEEDNEYLVMLNGKTKPVWMNGEVVEKAH